MFRVLVIEDEEGLRASIVRGLVKTPGVEVDDAANLDQGLEYIDQDAPNLIFSDIDMPERSGLELLGELGRRSLQIPVVFVTAYLKAYQAQIPRHANIDAIEKPVPLLRLRQIVEDHRGNTASKNAAPFNVADYLQIACMGHHSVEIQVTRNGSRLGEIIVANGQLWHASTEDLSGEAAFRLLASTTDSAVTCGRLEGNAGEQTISARWETLLLDAARVADEAAKAEVNLELDLVDTEATASAPAETSSEPTNEFDRAWNTGVDSLLDRNYDEALRAFKMAQKIDPDHAGVRANLERLGELLKDTNPEGDPS